MIPESLPSSSLILYQTEDGQTRIQCRFENETIWLTQIQMADLFQTSVSNINIHLKTIYAEAELKEAATIKNYLIVRTEGSRITAETARDKAELEYARYRNWLDVQPRPVDADFDRAIKQLPRRGDKP